ncbi:MAG: ADOP family duplicated permease [Gemmatimonadota bacterium]
MDEEVRLHIEQRVAQLVAEGMNREWAEAEAWRRFARREETVAALYHTARKRDRRMRMTTWLEGWGQDVRHACRVLVRAPALPAVVVLVLALGIGANATIFSAAYGLLERRLPVADADRLARVYRGDHSPLPMEDYLAIAGATETFGALTAERMIRVGLGAEDGTEPVQAALVSANYFTGLGVAAARGRVFAGAPGADPGAVAVLSHRYWRTRFGADPGVVGRTLRLADRPFTVVGVAAPEWVSSQAWRPDVFVPLASHAALLGVAPGSWNGSLYVTGRLAEGRTRAQALAEVEALAARLPSAAAAVATGQPVRFRVEHARGLTQEVRGPATLASVFLLALVALVLLIACANVANLLLARAAFRTREMAVRLALGVTRWRLVRQLLTESVLLALVAGVAAVALAVVGSRFLASLVPAGMPIHLSLTPDAAVLAFTALLSVATGVLFGLVPALRATRTDVQGALREDARGGYRRSRLRAAFLVAQVSLGTILLTGAGLFAQSLRNARDLDPGFAAAEVMDLPIDVSLRGYDEARGRAFYDAVAERAAAVAGVRAAALANLVPLGGANRGAPMQPAAADPDDRTAFQQAYYNTVTPGYFATLQLPLRAGRDFTPADEAGAAPVVIVNEAAAQALWPGERAVGQVLRMWDEGMPEYTVVGVAADAVYNALGEGPTPFLYFPFAQDYRTDMVLHARVAGAAGGRLRDAVAALDPALPLEAARPMEADMGYALVPARIGAGLLGGFAALALLLAAIGIYAVTAFMVARRTAEIAVRTALGARRWDVLRLILRETLGTVGVGLVLGLAGGAGLGVLVASQLYGVDPLDPLTFTAVPVVLLAVATGAVLLPALRALALDPVVALRRE